MEGSVTGVFDREQSGVDERAAALRRRVQADVDRGPSGIGGPRALIGWQRVVVVAQQQNGKPAQLKFMAQQAAEAESYVLFGELIGQGCPAFAAAVRGIDNGENARDCWRRSGGWRLRRIRRTLGRRRAGRVRHSGRRG